MHNLQTRPSVTKPGKQSGNQLRRQLGEHTNTIPKEERLRRTQELLANDLVRQRLAKQIVESGFRSRLEDIQAGTFPSSKTGDGTDIVVTSPYGEIPWNRLARISDDEMKQLNKGAVTWMYNFLTDLLGGNCWPLLETLRERDPLPHWDTPNT
jgi:hypothetical protein